MLEPRHPDLVTVGAESYVRDLNGTSRDGLNAETRSTLDALVESIEVAILKGPNASADDIPFSYELMAAIPASHAGHFISQSQLGWGYDGAGLIAIGTEQNYQLVDNLGPLTLDCASHIIWLCGSRPEIVERLGNGPAFTLEGQARRGPYHINFARYHPSGPTWRRLAEIVAPGTSAWQADLGNHCYQIELRGEPAPHPDHKRAVNAARLDFLRQAMTRLRETATVALFHGTGTHESAAELGSLFLGTKALPVGIRREAPLRKGVAWCTHHDADGRRVILSWAMGDRRAGGAYTQLIRELVQQVLVRGTSPNR